MRAAALVLLLGGCAMGYTTVSQSGAIRVVSVNVLRGRTVVVLPEKAAVSTETELRLVEALSAIPSGLWDLLTATTDPLPPAPARGPREDL